MEEAKRQLLPTPVIVVPLGKCMYTCQKGTVPDLANNSKVVKDFEASLEQFATGSVERAYMNAMLANAIMVADGVKSKADRRNRLLEDVDHTCKEMEDCIELNARWWEIFKMGLSFVIAGFFSWAIFAFVASIPFFKGALAKTDHGTGYAAIITTLGGLMIWSPIRAKIAQRRAMRLSHYRRKATGRIWKEYGKGVKGEYYHGINSMNIAWQNMTGEEPPDQQIANMMLQGLFDESHEDEQIHTAPDFSLRDLLALLPWPRRKAA
jgi:hypothetical protein